MVGELLGPVEPTANIVQQAVPAAEPRHLGPFVLGYLEALLRAADVRASRNPGKGAER
jgi:CRISPR-associated endonuclease/helicase Cas3